MHSAPVKQIVTKCTVLFGSVAAVKEPYERLQWIRRQRGFETATEAARSHGWNENTYRSHENGTRPMGKGAAARYARAYKAPTGWLLYAEGSPGIPLTAPLVGYVGAGSQAYFFNEDNQPIDDVELPPGGSSTTVAVQVRGSSMAGIADDGWLIYYDNIHTPPTDECLNRLCVVQLMDGRVLVKRLMRGREDGLFDLWSTNEPPIQSVQVLWAAKVTWIKPR